MFGALDFDKPGWRQYEQGAVEHQPQRKRAGYILWFGPLFDELLHGSHDAMSPAADRWQRRLIGAIRSRGFDVDVVSYTIAPFWPRGRLTFPSARNSGDDGLDVEQLAYLNLPYWRATSLATKRVVASIERKRRRGGPPLAVVTYNAHPNVTLPAMVLRAAMKVPWLCIIADIKERYLTALGAAEWVAAGRADSRVYLSSAMAQHFSRGTDLHLDGGIEPQQSPSLGQPGNVLYAGALTRGAGVELAIAAFAHVRNSAARLTICGQGDEAAVRALARHDPRIMVRGLVAADALADVMASARVFLNPRLPDLVENQRNFPSKLLDYLAYGKPIVSTWTDGLTADYRNVLSIADADSAAFGAAIDACLAMSDATLRALRDKIGEFARQHTWPAQADRFLATVARLGDGFSSGDS